MVCVLGTEDRELQKAEERVRSRGLAESGSCRMLDLGR